MQTRWQRWCALSIVVHGALVAVAVRAAPPRGASVDVRAPVSVEFDAPAMPTPDGAGDGRGPQRTPDARHERLGGARDGQNVDSDNRGEGGDARSAERARMMAARAEGVNLDARQMDSFDRTQEQRIRTARTRASPQDDRRTPNPADDPWVATGDGILLVRLTPSPAMPAEGPRAPTHTRTAAGDAREAVITPTDPTPAAISAHHAGALAQTAAGVRRATGASPNTAGPMQTQRAAIAQGHASTTADQASERPSDDDDAAMLAATLMRAHVNASSQQGPVRADGVGGVGGGGAPGSGGGLGRGGVARPSGDGDGALSLDTGDGRYVRYFGLVRRRIASLTADAFPYDEALQLRQGTVIVTFTIESSGRVRDVTVVRASGVSRYDANVRRALTGATMPPLPASFGRTSLLIRAPIAFLNPVVR